MLTVVGYPFTIAFSIFSFFQVGFNLEDFKRNLANRRLVTDTLFNPKWDWAIENASLALIETIQIAILASILGCFISLPLSFYETSMMTSPQLSDAEASSRIKASEHSLV